MRLYQYVKECVITPTKLYSTKTPPKWSFEFDVDTSMLPRTLQEEDNITASSYMLASSGDCTYRARCCQVLAAEVERLSANIGDWLKKKIIWPRHVFGFLTGEILEVRRAAKFGQNLPINLTPFVAHGRNDLSLNVHYDSDELNKSFMVAVEVIEILSHEAILATCKTEPYNIPCVDGHNRIIESLKPSADSDDDFAIVCSSVTVDMTDPFSAKLVDIPTRTVSCRHHDCFDLETFLLSRQPIGKYPGCPSSADGWKCPRCGADARPSMLRIDGFLQKVRAQLEAKGKLDTKAVKVTEEGWELVPEKEARPAKRARIEVHLKDDKPTTGEGNKKPKKEPIVIELD